MTGELTLLVLRLIFLAVMWIFVFSIIYSLRSDLFGSASRDYQKAMEQSRQQTFGGGAATPASAQDAPAPAPTPVPAGAAARSRPTAASASTPPQPGSQPRPAGFTRLVITSGPKRGTEIDLGQQPVSIGRAPDSDLVVQDDYSSTRHARLLNWNGRWMVQDLDSTNGTFVNDERIGQPTEIRAGSSVRIGTTTFELR